MPYRHDSQDACPQKQAVWSKMARKEENIFQSLMQYKTGHGVQVCLNLFREALQCTRFRLFFLLKKIVVPCFCFSLIVKSTSFMFTTHRITAPVETKALAPNALPCENHKFIPPNQSAHGDLVVTGRRGQRRGQRADVAHADLWHVGRKQRARAWGAVDIVDPRRERTDAHTNAQCTPSGGNGQYFPGRGNAPAGDPQVAPGARSRTAGPL